MREFMWRRVIYDQASIRVGCSKMHLPFTLQWPRNARTSVMPLAEAIQFHDENAKIFKLSRLPALSHD